MTKFANEERDSLRENLDRYRKSDIDYQNMAPSEGPAFFRIGAYLGALNCHIIYVEYGENKTRAKQGIKMLHGSKKKGENSNM